MTKRDLSHREVIALLEAACESEGNASSWARLHGCSAVYVSDVLSGKRNPGPKILKALKLSRHENREVLYRKAS